MDGSDPPRTRWSKARIRVSVRTLMAAILVVAGLVGWVVGEVKGRMRAARARRDVVAEIRAANFVVLYDWQWDHDKISNAPRPWPRWLVDLVGIDFLSQPAFVDLKYPITPGSNRGPVFPMGRVDAGFMARLGRLERLEYLDLSRNPLVTDADLVHLERMTRLRQLYFTNNAIVGPGLAHLEKLTSLEELSLSRMPKLVTVAPVARVRSLRKLSVVFPPNDTLLADLGGTTHLQSLTLSGGNVDDTHMPQIARIASLQDLSLSGAKITDAGLLHLRSLKDLKVLRIHSERVTDAGVKALQDHLPGVKITRK